MYTAAVIFVLLFFIGVYVGIVALISSALQMKNGRSAFWWIFFFGLIGAVIALLIDIRDGNYKKTDIL